MQGPRIGVTPFSHKRGAKPYIPYTKHLQPTATRSTYPGVGFFKTLHQAYIPYIPVSQATRGPEPGAQIHHATFLASPANSSASLGCGPSRRIS